MKNKLSKIFVLSLVVLIIATGLWAHDHHGEHGKMCLRLSYGYMFLVKKLNEASFLQKAKLPTSKVKKIQNVLRNAHKKTKALRKKLKRMKRRIHQLLDARPVNRGKILSISRRIHNLSWIVVRQKKNVRVTIEQLLTKKESQTLREAIAPY